MQRSIYVADGSKKRVSEMLTFFLLVEIPSQVWHLGVRASLIFLYYNIEKQSPPSRDESSSQLLGVCYIGKNVVPL